MPERPSVRPTSGHRARFDARVLAREDAGGGLVLVTLDPHEEVRGSYTKPGQYVAARSGASAADAAHEGLFVLAGDVGADSWQLVLRPGGSAADAILGEASQSLHTSGALGTGFPWEEARGRPLLLAATGSGVAAMRPVVGLRIRNGDGPRTELLVGVRVRNDTPLGPELERWRKAGVHVTVCLSRESSPEGSRGTDDGYRAGYVQDVARERAAAGRNALASGNGMIFAAGVKPMIEGMRRVAGELGVAEADVRTNY